MADLTLDYEGLEAQGRKVAQQRDQFNHLIAEVLSTVRAVEQSWNNTAAKDFVDKVQNMQSTFNAFEQVLGSLSDHMLGVAKNYRELQTNIINSQKF